MLCANEEIVRAENIDCDFRRLDGYLIPSDEGGLDLLEAAGVDSCAELAQRNAANLAITFQELDAARLDERQLASYESLTEAGRAFAKANARFFDEEVARGKGLAEPAKAVLRP